MLRLYKPNKYDTYTFEIVSEALKVNSLNSCDIDEANIINIDSKYYTWDEFTKIRNKPKSFNILHSNVYKWL